MTSRSPYRTTPDPLGALRDEYRGQWTGQILFGTGCVVVVIVVIACYCTSLLVGLGSFSAIVADAQKLGDSRVLIVPFMLAFAGFLGWLMTVMTGAIRHGRVRFYERGLEVIDRKRQVKRCRFEEIESAELADDRSSGGRGNVVVAKVRLLNGEVWTLGGWFAVTEIVARLSVAIRKSRAGAG